MTKRKEPARACPSGEHPIVEKFRSKLASVHDGVADDLESLDRDLASYLESVRTPVPPSK